MFKKSKKSILGVFIVIIMILAAGTLGFFIRDAQANNYSLSNEVPKKLETFKNVLNIVQNYYVEDVNLDKILTGAIKGMLESLDDPYTNYLSKQDYENMKTDFKGEFGGIGIVVTMREGNLMIVSPIEGTPGFEAELKAGDIIAKVNDQSTEDMTIKEAVNLMKGEPGTEVNLTIKRKVNKKETNQEKEVTNKKEPNENEDNDSEEQLKEEKTIEVSIIRETIEIPYVKSEMKANDIGYIRVVQFAEDVGKDVQKELNELKKQGMKGVILDLRNNPGGLLPQAVSVASNFIPNGPIVHIKQKKGKKETILASSEIEPIELPMVVLVNQGSASASEIVAGAVQDTNIGTLLGTKTFGKGVVQTVVPLDDGSALKLTTARYYTPKERYINEKGIKPDIKVEYDSETEQDDQLQRSIEFLKEKIKQTSKSKLKSAS